MRRVLYISGSRADYGIARGLLQAVQADPDLDLKVLVTSMHLDPMHGETWKELSADGLNISQKVPGRLPGDSLEAMAGSVGIYLNGISQALARDLPDVVLVLGDRGEQLAGAMAAAFQNLTVAHLCGGSISGSIDDSIRHAITKFAHYHLTASQEHALRVVRMGEDPETVHVVGLPGADLRPDVVFSKDQIRSQLGLPLDQSYLLVVQHSVTHSQEKAEDQIIETLEAAVASGYPTLLANPNDDAGGRVILATMKEYAQRHQTLRILPPPGSREMFASIMANAAALVGNSSTAVAEAMSIPLPVVNIGDRQRGRERLACWVNVPHQRDDIRQGIEAALNDGSYLARLRNFESPLIRRDTNQLVLDCLKSTDLERGRRPKVFYEPAEAMPTADPLGARSA